MSDLPRFARDLFDPERRQSRIGGGALGGKALGLIRAGEVLAGLGDAASAAAIEVDVPALVVLGTDFFERFVEANGLERLADGGAADREIAAAFHRAPVPAELVGDLRALAESARVPLAVRSSSALEDALGEPFAGVYGTKMIPGDQPDATGRYRALADAVKFVWASTLFAEARAYRAATSSRATAERMAVIVQEVVGRRRGSRFYPDLSGVARSYSFYPPPGAQPEDGALDLALGLGKTIVDGERCWTISPARPTAPPPFASARELLESTQNGFWAIRVGSLPPYDPVAETEFLVREDLSTAEVDGTLALAGSTYDAAADAVRPGLGRAGPRVIDFGPLLRFGELPLVATVRSLLSACESALGAPVEIEFALTTGVGRPARLGFLQVRPLLVTADEVEITGEELGGPATLLATELASGNGRRLFEDVIWVDPERFETRHLPAVAAEVERWNRSLVGEGRDYLLAGFGRWGSVDPWLGPPVRWDQIAGARAIVEAGIEGFRPEPSQGSHFFHNLSSFGVLYLSLPPGAGAESFWNFLAAQPEIGRGEHVRHARLPVPVEVAVDGRTRRGLIRRTEGA